MASKRYEQAATLVKRDQTYSLAEAVKVLKSFPKTKFDETVEVSISLGIDPAKTDQAVRGTVVLPNGTGKTVKVVVLCKGERELIAKQAGADYVGSADLIKKIEDGWLDFDVAIATPDMMRDVSRLGKVLGPRGLMPNPKAGTVTDDVAKAISDVRKGKVEFKMDKTANLHVVVGKASFDEKKLEENAASVIDAVARAKPAAVKGTYIRRVVVSATMSPGVAVDVKPFIVKETD